MFDFGHGGTAMRNQMKNFLKGFRRRRNNVKIDIVGFRRRCAEPGAARLQRIGNIIDIGNAAFVMYL